MKQISTLLAIVFLFIITSCDNKSNNTSNSFVHIQVQFSDSLQQKNIVIPWYDGITALTALQYSSIVEKHPVGKYVFVTAIDNVHGKRGVKAWYYKVNGIPPKKLAVNNLLNKNDTILWIYKKDVCSATVDSIQ